MSTSTDAVAILLLSLQRICRNLSYLLNALDADVDSFEQLLREITSSMHKSSSSSTIEYDEDFEKTEDYYENLCDEQLEPRPIRVTML
jgi:hypothetical protein